MKLYFENRRGEERLIADCETVEEVHKEIDKFLDDHGYYCCYFRSWEEGGGVKIDFGSWSQFFFIDEVTHSEFWGNTQKM